MKRKLLFAALCVVGALGTLRAQMTDVTSTYITNAGFETDDAASDLTGGSTQNTPTGWTITPSSLGNTQWGTANASTKIQGLAAKEDPTAGDKYFYFRDNWQNGTNISVSQASIAEVPAGNYIVYVDVFTYSSNGTQPVYSFTVKDGETTYVNGSITANKQAWATYYYHFKLESAATLTFSANMTPKAAASGKHDWMLLDNIRLLKADNTPAEPVANNTTDLYLYNEATGLYLSAGRSWGTHATVDGTGHPITATLSNGVYKLKTQEFNKYLGGLYMDASEVDWLFFETSIGSGKYYMTQDGYNYMTSNGAGAEVVNVTSPTEASVWTFVSKADRKAALSSATIDVPGNATFMLPDPNFGRNNAAYSNWTWTFPNGENKNNSGNNENFVVECYHKQFTFKHTLAAGTLPAGVYGVTAQGFYRQDGSDNENLPVFYVNSEKQTFPPRTGSEDSMNKASTSFSAGSYTIEPIYIRIEDVDAFEVGATLATNESLWCIWDNFQIQYYGDVTVAAVKMKASVDAYNAAMGEAQAFTEGSMFASDWTALQTAISSNTLDLNDPALTEEALTTATANLVAANTAATAAVAGKTTYSTAVSTIDGGTDVDLTSLITNPGFETGTTTGWTNAGVVNIQAQNNNSFDNKQGTWYAERWHVSGAIDFNQTVKYLPAGIYKIEAYMFSDTGDAKLYANSEEVAVSTSQKYFAVVEIADKSSIKIGASCTLTGSTWICLDDFKMTYLASSYAEMPYTLATGKMGTDKSAAQASAKATFLADPNKTTYEALLTAIAAAEASKANYDKLKTAIDKAEGVRDANNFVTAAATTALENEISTATTAWTDVTYTDAQCTSEIATLGSTVSGWHAIADEGVSGAYIASTWSKTHENWFDAPYINTWSTEGDNDGSDFSVPFFEYYTDNNQNLAANTFTAILSGLDNGAYEVELWARVQRRSDADFNSNNSMITMSVNDGEAVSIMSGQTTVGSGTSVMRLGRYKAYGQVTDGTLTLSINVKLGANVHWLCWRDVKYTKLSDVTIDEASTTAPEAVAFANVTLTRTLSTEYWNTFCSPVDITADEINTLFGANSKVREMDTEATVADNTIPFKDATSIVAGVPYLVKPETEVKNPSFTGKTIVAEGQTVRNGEYKYIGILAKTTLAAPTNEATALDLYLSTTGTMKKPGTNGANLKGMRAYFNVPAAAANSGVKLFIDGETDAIDMIDGEPVAGAAIYNIAGQRVNKAQRGIYIINGKKVLVK